MRNLRAHAVFYARTIIRGELPRFLRKTDRMTWYEEGIRVVLGSLGLYTAVGAVFAIAFCLQGVQRVDSQAVGTGWGFRLLIAPGVVVFWPLLLQRWMGGASDPPLAANPHRGVSGIQDREMQR